mgnify:CR=1 FL=1
MKTLNIADKIPQNHLNVEHEDETTSQYLDRSWKEREALRLADEAICNEAIEWLENDIKNDAIRASKSVIKKPQILIKNDGTFKRDFSAILAKRSELLKNRKNRENDTNSRRTRSKNQDSKNAALLDIIMAERVRLGGDGSILPVGDYLPPFNTLKSSIPTGRNVNISNWIYINELALNFTENRSQKVVPFTLNFPPDFIEAYRHQKKNLSNYIQEKIQKKLKQVSLNIPFHFVVETGDEKNKLHIHGSTILTDNEVERFKKALLNVCGSNIDNRNSLKLSSSKRKTITEKHNPAYASLGWSIYISKELRQNYIRYGIKNPTGCNQLMSKIARSYYERARG